LDVHLVDGTYELFRHCYALPSARDKDGTEIAALRGVLTSVLDMIKRGAANASALADTLCREREHALLFRTLATLRTDIALFDDVDQLRWNGPTPAFAALAARLDAAVTETRRSAKVTRFDTTGERTSPVFRSAKKTSGVPSGTVGASVPESTQPK
jgi:hypothetical protein